MCLKDSLENTEGWIKIFEGIKDYLFVALCDPEICSSAVVVLTRFITD